MNHIKVKTAGVSIINIDTCASTNTLAKEYAENGTSEKTVIIAKMQTGGRGRMGRSFFSPENTGLYMSIILRPALTSDKALEITTAAAVAAARIIERACKSDVKIKWVNDIYKNGKKVCGILTEASVNTDSSINYAVLGIGVNLFKPQNGFPDDISSIADSVYDCGYNEELKNEFTVMLIDEFFSIYPIIGQNSFVSEYRSRSLITGRDIYILSDDKKIPAKADAIGDDYSLHVTLDDGSKRVLNSGDVSIKVK
ncbi:MAG: biotin--[acetyl-CoA-carboxylase] ligase [Ruminococcaceae bacterium]|nr:biotin--[acetyl-CoA-carboxylase] ligase [Oscillospiraceae bacterium]